MHLNSDELEKYMMKEVDKILDEQAAPVANKNIAIWDLVVADMIQRNKDGIKKYGTPLQADNGRHALWDAYQEALDLCVYLRQRIEEDKNERPHD